MKRIVLVVKKSDRAATVAEGLVSWLGRHGCEAVVDSALPVSGVGEAAASEVLDPTATDLGVVLGGDGTLLYAARTLGRHGVPLLGVNLGGLGFLTEISLDNMYPVLERVLNGDFELESRMMLSVEVLRDGSTAVRNTVLNDVVVNKGALARILELAVTVDKTPVISYRADGLIISTPTGSTAYNLSAGGPIVHPAHETIILTPICPFKLSNRPLILPAVATIEAAVDPEASDVFLTSDGQVSFPLEPGDRILVQRSEAKLTLIKSPYQDYFEILRTKLGWG